MKMKWQSALWLLLAFVLCVPATAFGWGREGHEAIAKIAERHLTHKARARIERYLDRHSIIYYAKWMDEYRNTPEYGFTGKWHTVPVGSGLSYSDSLRALQGDAIFGIETAIRQLQDYRKLSDSIVAFNIKCLVHLVGDMHCPAHIKYADRQMRYFVQLVDNSGTYRRLHIHHVWDYGIIRAARIWSSSEWADELDRLSKTERQTVASGSPRDWLHESAVRCEVQFDWTHPDDRLGQEFLNRSLPLIERQIRDAGYRLAAILNDLFG